MRIKDINIFIDSINQAVKDYDLKDNDLLLGIDKHLQGGMDLVVYDISDMLEHPKDFEEFTSIINENGLDEEEFEADRYCLVKNKEDN